jgi:hypothetical protein
MLADRPCGRALQSAKQKLFSAPLRGPQRRKAGTPGALLALFLYLLCAASAAGFFNLEIPFSVFQTTFVEYLNTLLTLVSSPFRSKFQHPIKAAVKPHYKGPVKAHYKCRPLLFLVVV